MLSSAILRSAYDPGLKIVGENHQNLSCTKKEIRVRLKLFISNNATIFIYILLFFYYSFKEKGK